MKQMTRTPATERGLATLDVLTGIAIFALVALIAVSTLSQYRARAYQTGTISDVRAVSIAIESAYIDSATYPADIGAVEALLTTELMVLTPHNSIASYDITGDDFELCVEHDAGEAWASYESEHGVFSTGRTGGCP